MPRRVNERSDPEVVTLRPVDPKETATEAPPDVQPPAVALLDVRLVLGAPQYHSKSVQVVEDLVHPVGQRQNRHNKVHCVLRTALAISRRHGRAPVRVHFRSFTALDLRTFFFSVKSAKIPSASTAACPSATAAGTRRATFNCGRVFLVT